jgi:hypothetical protein
MRHNINGEDWIPWSDIEKWYKNKVTREQLEQAVRDGVVRTTTLQYRDTPYVYEVYAEGDIIMAIANHKFKAQIDVDKWWE